MITCRYGQGYIRYNEPMGYIVPPPPPTLWQRIRDPLINIAWMTAWATTGICFAWANPEVFFRAFAVGFVAAIAASLAR